MHQDLFRAHVIDAPHTRPWEKRKPRSALLALLLPERAGTFLPGFHELCNKVGRGGQGSALERVTSCIRSRQSEHDLKGLVLQRHDDDPELQELIQHQAQNGEERLAAV